MKRFLFCGTGWAVAVTVGVLTVQAQTSDVQLRREVTYYVEQAYANSPLIREQEAMQQIDTEQTSMLRAQYTRSRVEATGEYLFVPIVERTNGGTAFRWNAQDGADYYGYDLGISSGHLQAGVTWTQPLTGGAAYRAARQRSDIRQAQYKQQIRLQRHELRRAVIEQYLLCLADREEQALTDSIGVLLQRQRRIFAELARAALIRQSDMGLLDIEIKENQKNAAACRQSQTTHLSELHVLCGIADEPDAELVPLHMRAADTPAQSLFGETYRLDSLGAAADYRLFRMQYRPQVSLFADGGLRAVRPNEMWRRVGISAGIVFSWRLFDGGQRQMKYRQTQAQITATQFARQQQSIIVSQRTAACRRSLAEQKERMLLSEAQLDDYRTLLAAYEKEISAGQISVTDYITVLKNYIREQQNYRLLCINKELIINALNYWLW